MSSTVRIKTGAKTIGWLWLWVWSFAATSQSQPRDSVYQLRAGREIALIAVGGATNVVALYLAERTPTLTAAQIDQLNRRSVNAFDRGATRNWSPTAARISDFTLIGTVGMVGLTGLPTLRQRKWYTVPLLYAETMLFTAGTVGITKELVLRNRPFVYNSAAPLAEKEQKDARRSFFSGHAAGSFASAVFASTVFGHYFPVSKLRPVVWAGSLTLATASSLLRYEAGKHYPTDILLGAAVGSALGWGIPKLHRPKVRPGKRPLDLTVLPWSNGLASGAYVRLLIN